MSFKLYVNLIVEVVISQLHAKQSTVYKTKHDVIFFILFNTQLHILFDSYYICDATLIRTELVLTYFGMQHCATISATIHKTPRLKQEKENKNK